MMAADYWMLMAERVGIPMTILFFFGLAVWASLKWLARKIFEPMVQSHVELVEEAKIASKVNSDTLIKVSETVALASESLATLNERNLHMYELVKSNTRRLDELVEGEIPIIREEASMNGPLKPGLHKKDS